MKLIIVTLSIILSFYTQANETCSRIAIIDQQEVLVDPSSNKKGEGLRYHLSKDPAALKYLNKYQKTSSNKWRAATIGTIGTALILSAFVTNTSKDSRKALMIAGSSTLLVNFLLSKTIDNANEEHLNKAIREYNKRNFPKIFFRQDTNSNIKPGVFLNKNWSF